MIAGIRIGYKGAKRDQSSFKGNPSSTEVHRPTAYIAVAESAITNPYLACLLQASKGLEKKGAKLHQIQLQEQAKLDKAEERMEARAAAKRKRQEEKQAEKAEIKR